jgi:hypothetical protein
LQFSFTNAAGALFAVASSTDILAPASNWTWMGGATEVSPGNYQFTDPQSAADGARFYRVMSQ